jgi:hypothetical protein
MPEGDEHLVAIAMPHKPDSGEDILTTLTEFKCLISERATITGCGKAAGLARRWRVARALTQHRLGKFNRSRDAFDEKNINR